MDKLIERALRDAKRLPEGETGVCGIRRSVDGMIIRVEYHTVGRTNICDDARVVTPEKWDWEQAGCTNNEEWRRHLNRLMWADYSAGLYQQNK